MRQLCLTTLLLLTAILETRGEELQGARKALEAIQGTKAAPVVTDSDATSKPDFQAELDAYQKIVSTLNPEDQAKAWLKLYQVSLASDAESVSHLQSDGDVEYLYDLSVTLLRVLPPPAAWPSLATEIQALPLPEDPQALIAAHGLRILGSHLVNDQEGVKRSLEAIDQIVNVKPEGQQKQAEKAPSILGQIFGFSETSTPADPQQKLRQKVSDLKILILASDPLQRFTEELAALEKNKTSEDHHFRSLTIKVPDLVNLAGPDQAAELLLKAFESEGASFEFNPQFQETFLLGRELALKNLKSLKNSPWSLCLSIDSHELYESLSKNTGDSQNFWDSSLTEADAYYLRGIVIRKEYEKGVQAILQEERLQEGMTAILYHWKQMPGTDRIQEQTWTFFQMVLEKRPDLPLWDALTVYSVAAGKKAETLEFIDRMLRAAAGDKTKLRSIERARANVLLAYGDIDPAMQTFLSSLEEAPAEDDAPLQKEMELALKVTQIGTVLKNDTWIDAGVKHFEKCIEVSTKPGDPEEGYSSNYLLEHYLTQLIDVMLETNRLPQAEKILIDYLSREMKKFPQNTSLGDSSPGAMLVRVYAKAGRFEDVILLLDDLKVLGGKDLTDYIRSSGEGHVAVAACNAFINMGQPELARKIAERMVVAMPGKDAGWKLLSELAGEDLPPIAERVFQRDQFEERPLIWLADYQLKKGQIEEAEKTIRKAISIDPSDGEQGKGDRMRAYAVLARILDAKKDPQAEVFRGAVAAIRLAEEADQFRLAGLHSRAIEMYLESLTHFADAYCIQSRLAVQLAEAGDLEAAAKHYQRAFELMPDSFGRVESHCFGCEGVFGGELATSIAKKVFDELSINRPNDPKVHYLTGYLAKSQLDYERALAEFALATKLDPDYLNAWSELNSLQENMTVPQKILDESRLNLYRLAPLRAEGTKDLKAVRDLNGLWEIADGVSRRIPHIESEPLYPLAGSKKTEAEEVNGANTTVTFTSEGDDDSSGSELEDPQSASKLLAENELLLAIGKLLEEGRQKH